MYVTLILSTWTIWWGNHHHLESTTKTPLDHVAEIGQFIQSFSAQANYSITRTCRRQFGQDISWYDGCNSTSIRQFVCHYMKLSIYHSKLLGDSVTNLQCKTSAYTGRSH